MGDTLAGRELLLGGADVLEQLKALLHRFELTYVDEHRDPTTTLREEHGTPRLVDLLRERGYMGSEFGERADILIKAYGAHEDMLDEIAILRDIRIAEEQIARGEGIPHDEVVARLRARLIE